MTSESKPKTYALVKKGQTFKSYEKGDTNRFAHGIFTSSNTDPFTKPTGEFLSKQPTSNIHFDFLLEERDIETINKTTYFNYHTLRPA